MFQDRLAAVFTSIENLPCAGEKADEHRWIEDYCHKCRRCAVECPPQAVLDQPVRQENGLVTCVDTAKCFPYFFEFFGCSICIRVCPFQEQGYEKLKRGFLAP